MEAKQALSKISIEYAVKSIREDREQMKYVFDSPSIIRAITEDKISILAGNYTLDLAYYELGNIVWKKRVIKDLGSEEAEKIIEIINGDH